MAKPKSTAKRPKSPAPEPDPDNTLLAKLETAGIMRAALLATGPKNQRRVVMRLSIPTQTNQVVFAHFEMVQVLALRELCDSVIRGSATHIIDIEPPVHHE